MYYLLSSNVLLSTSCRKIEFNNFSGQKRSFERLDSADCKQRSDEVKSRRCLESLIAACCRGTPVAVSNEYSQ